MVKSFYAIKSLRGVLVLAWFAIVALHASLLYMFGYPWQAAIADGFVSNILLLGACVLISNTLQYYLPTNNKLQFLGALIAFSLIIWFVIARSALMLLPFTNIDYSQFWTISMPIRLTMAGLIILANTLLSLFWITIQQHQDEEQKAIRLQALAKEVELMKLRQQLQPHFLFNSLNSISALVVSNPKGARNMVHQLADFFRGTIASEQKQTHTLADELTHLKLYLAIEEVRFGHRLVNSFDIDLDAEGAILPALLLQPVLENAIKYGLYDTTEIVHISLLASMQKGFLKIEVSNPFDSETSTKPKGTGFGLESINQRLFLLFGRRGLLTTHTENNIFTTKLIIPQL